MRTIFIDTETAGLDPKSGVVEIAIIEVDENLDPIAEYTSLIDPEGPISPSASGVHGITQKDVADAPTLCQFFAVENIRDYCEESLLVIGHNVQFDLNFLAGHLRGEVTPVCTLRLARKIYPDAENCKLQTLRYVFGLDAGNAHSAHGDTILCLNLFRRMQQETGCSIVELATLAGQPTLVKKMPFGKHKGTAVDALPSGYKKWLLDQDIDADLRYSLNQ